MMAGEGANPEERWLDGVEGDGKSAIADGAWRPEDLALEPPELQVTQPAGSFCHINACFPVPLPPNYVYDIITDPNNRRIFKNVKEVVYRKVLQDDGNRQLVEVEQLGRWRFLFFSGTFACRVLVEQDRKNHTMNFDLIKQGMMKRFSGSWKIQPLLRRHENSECASKLRRSEPFSEGEEGSWIIFSQDVEPAIVPPWPLSHYVRRVSAQIVREILGDLQGECIRLKESKGAAANDH